MNIRFIHILLFFCLCLYAIDLSGQSRKVHFDKLGAVDGLRQSHIFSMLQDSDGFMWFCTLGGLSKYDGLKFTNYIHARQDSTTISGDWVYKIVEATPETFYVGTTTGLNVFNKRTEKFIRYTAQPDKEEGLINGRIQDVEIAKNGLVWMAHAKGLSSFDPRSKKFKNYPHPKFKFSRHAPDVFITGDGSIYGGAENGLYTLSPDRTKLLNIPIELNNIQCRVRNIQERDGQLWLATNYGLFTYDLQSKKSKLVQLALPDKSPSVNCIAWDTDSTAYIGGLIGLHKINTNRPAVEISYNYAANNPEGISGDVVYSLLKDKADNLWIGLFDGINIINPQLENFRTYFNEPGLNNLRNATLELHSTKDGAIWSSTMKGLFYKSSLNAISKPLKFPGYILYQHVPAIGFAEDARGIFWLLLKDKGLFNNATGKFDFRSISSGEELGVTRFGIMTNRRHNADEFLIPTNKGLLQYNALSKDTSWLRPTTYDGGISSNSIGALAEDESGTLWFVCGGQLCSYDSTTDQFKKYRSDANDSTAWFGRSTHNIGTANGLIYLGGSAFSYYDTRSQRFVNYTKENTAFMSTVPGIVADKNGDAWFSSGPAIWHFDAVNHSLQRHITAPQVGGYVTSAACITHDGRPLFGSYKGITEVRPWQITPDSEDIDLVWSDMTIDNNAVDRKEAFEFMDTLKMRYTNSLLILEFSALKFTKKESIQYKYQLQGSSDQWLNLGNRREITFTNLAPGNYYLAVTASNADGAKSRKPLTLHIEVAPPFWQTNVFYALLTAVLLFIAWLIFKNAKHTQQLKQEKAIAEQNDKYKSRFLAHMSHEFRTPMNAIMGMNQLLMNSNLSEKQMQYAESIQVSCDNLLWIVNNILDQAKIESGTMNLQHAPFDPKEVLQQVYKLLNVKATEKQLNLAINIDESIPNQLMGDPVRLFQILINLTDNAIKFTAKGTVKLTANLLASEPGNATLSFIISDTGIGLDQNVLDAIFERFEQVDQTEHVAEGTGLGLAIVKDLVNIMKGKIEVASQKGKGSTFSVTIPFKTVDQTSPIKKPVDHIAKLPNGLKILLVEDLETNRFVARELLKQHNSTIEIVESENGALALEMVQQNQYDAILMDVRMPVMDGLLATRKIRALNNERYKKLLIIGLTANATPEQLDACIAAGMNDIVTKPLDIHQLIKCISKHLNGHVNI